MSLRRRITLGLIPAAAILLAAPAAGAATAPAHAQVIFGPCTPLQDGQIKVIGPFLYECVFVRGLGYYWVRYENSCGGAAVRDTAARRC